ncbi:MAG: NTP transferase domain-containing protein [Oscillospiraceae bacterium]|nr:NTP transferase domain-containing protein [Oscillospiraceae bacterium]
MKTTLVIMAAGLGSRFGEGIKQLTPVGANGEIIMDYSIHDAVEAGFERIIFVIRRDIEKEFREAIGERIEKVCDRLGVTVDCAFQALDDLPEGFSLPEGRKKPWGTCHAVLACRDLIDSPFAVINADDYYGKEAFRLVHGFLKNAESASELCMAGYILKNTLSESGGVTRGVCKVDQTGRLKRIDETRHIEKTAEGARADGVDLDPDSIVSMNMFGLPLQFMEALERGFGDFLSQMADPMTSEFLIPIFVNRLLLDGKITVKVLETHDKWFGMTYKEDTEGVREAFREYVEKGVYSSDLFSDLQ